MPPTTTLGGASETVTDAEGATVIVIDTVPVTPPAVAPIVTVPGATPFTSPVAETVATLASLVNYLQERVPKQVNLDLGAGKVQRPFAVVEGYTDVLMAHQFGVLNVVATMGTALNARHVKQLRRFAPRVTH